MSWPRAEIAELKAYDLRSCPPGPWDVPGLLSICQAQGRLHRGPDLLTLGVSHGVMWHLGGDHISGPREAYE